MCDDLMCVVFLFCVCVFTFTHCTAWEACFCFRGFDLFDNKQMPFKEPHSQKGVKTQEKDVKKQSKQTKHTTQNSFYRQKKQNKQNTKSISEPFLDPTVARAVGAGTGDLRTCRPAGEGGAVDTKRKKKLLGGNGFLVWCYQELDAK